VGLAVFRDRRLRYDTGWVDFPSQWTGASHLIRDNLDDDYKNLIYAIYLLRMCQTGIEYSLSNSGAVLELVTNPSENISQGYTLRPMDNNSFYLDIGKGGLRIISYSLSYPYEFLILDDNVNICTVSGGNVSNPILSRR